MKTRRNDYLQPASRVVPVRLRGILMSSVPSEQSGGDAEFQGYEVGDSLYLD
jgi:hypothetical protein